MATTQPLPSGSTCCAGTGVDARWLFAVRSIVAVPDLNPLNVAGHVVPAPGLVIHATSEPEYVPKLEPVKSLTPTRRKSRVSPSFG